MDWADRIAGPIAEKARPMKDDVVAFGELRDPIAQALRDERERCAKIAELPVVDGQINQICDGDTCDYIASLIRNQ